MLSRFLKLFGQNNSEKMDMDKGTVTATGTAGKCCHCDHKFYKPNTKHSTDKKYSMKASLVKSKSQKPGKDELLSVKILFVFQLFLKLNDCSIEGHENEQQKHYVCGKCHRLYSRFFTAYDEMLTTMTENSEMRKIILDSNRNNGESTNTSTPTVAPMQRVYTPQEPPKPKPKEKIQPMIRIATHLRQSITTVKGRRAYHKFTWMRLRREMRNLAKLTFLKTDITKDSIDFQSPEVALESIWIKLTKELEQYAPTVLRILEAMSGTKEYREVKVDTDYENIRCVRPPVGMAFCLLMLTINQHSNMVQNIIGLCLYKDGIRKETYKLLNYLKVSVAYPTVLANRSLLDDGFSEKEDEPDPDPVKNLKRKIEETELEIDESDVKEEYQSAESDDY